MRKYNRLKLIILISCICGALNGCDTMGQVGETINFHTSQAELSIAIDSLYAAHPEYKLPDKWAEYDNLPVRQSPFLEKRIFYFKSKPEEMYYVSLIDDSVMTGDTSRTGLAIRAVNRGGDWIQEDKFGYKEAKKIQKRFEVEIVEKLKEYTKAKVTRDE